MQRHFGISMATAAILSAVSSMSFADNAISLDDDQLDTVNAGAVAITANANATAFGPITKTITLTNTYTTSFVSPKGRYVELGVGVAVAEAVLRPIGRDRR